MKAKAYPVPHEEGRADLDLSRRPGQPAGIPALQSSSTSADVVVRRIDTNVGGSRPPKVGSTALMSACCIVTPHGPELERRHYTEGGWRLGRHHSHRRDRGYDVWLSLRRLPHKVRTAGPTMCGWCLSPCLAVRIAHPGHLWQRQCHMGCLKFRSMTRTPRPFRPVWTHPLPADQHWKNTGFDDPESTRRDASIPVHPKNILEAKTPSDGQAVDEASVASRSRMP